VRLCFGALEAFGNSEKAADEFHPHGALLKNLLETRGFDARTSKAAKFRSCQMRKMKSKTAWTLDEEAPSYSDNKITLPKKNPDQDNKP
jgi:hypothetical protein